MIPIPEQEDWARENFSHITPRITVTDASPYADRSRVSRASMLLKEANCDLIVMYCMGFTQELTKEVRSMTKKPVILSSTIVARTIGELLE
jgi:protein AroM